MTPVPAAAARNTSTAAGSSDHLPLEVVVPDLTNAEIAAVFRDIADLLVKKKESRFKIRAYRVAAESIEGLPEDIGLIAAGGRLREIPGVGEAITKKITELVTTGRLEYYEKLKGEFPEETG